MALAERRAEAVWQGDLTSGSGSVTGGSGALGTLPITWAARVERPDGKTSPEELLAAAHAACFAMALSNTLKRVGAPPERLTVDALCSLERTDTGVKIATMQLQGRGRGPGMERPGFVNAAQQAEQGWPVSNSLRSNA